VINKIAPDKWKHFFVGIVMGAVLQAFLLFLIPAHPVLDIVLSFILSVVIGYGFELASKITGRGHYDIMDAVASVLGGLIGMGIIILLKMDLFMNYHV
jgi:glycopeptide antibiotics resistance protein